jgi:hypothetical protein
MVYTLGYQMYMYQHGFTAAEQRAADVRAGEAAAALRDLRVFLGHAFRSLPRGRRAHAAGTATIRIAPSGR